MSTGMHPAVCGGEGKSRLLRLWQCIHVCAQEVTRAVGIAHGCDDTRMGNEHVWGETHGFQPFVHVGAGLKEVITALRMLMEPATVSNNLLLEGACLLQEVEHVTPLLSR